MTVKEAIEFLTKKVPGRIVTGYWLDGEDYILNTKTIKSMQGCIAPGQFVVTKNGEVYGTNPMQHNLDPDKMRRI